MENAILVQGQLALFFSSEVMRPDKLVYSLCEHIAEFKNLIPTVSMVPIFENNQQQLKPMANISYNGVNLSINTTRIDVIFPKIQDDDDIMPRFKKISEQLISNISFKIVRIGVVSTFFSSNINTDNYIFNEFINREKKNMKELAIRFNSPSQFETKNINRVFNIYNGFINSKHGQLYGTYYQQDINTQSQEEALSAVFMTNFLHKFSTNIVDCK